MGISVNERENDEEINDCEVKKKKKGMPSDYNGKPLHCHTSMAESVNNKMIR